MVYWLHIEFLVWNSLPGTCTFFSHSLLAFNIIDEKFDTSIILLLLKRSCSGSLQDFLFTLKFQNFNSIYVLLHLLPPILLQTWLALIMYTFEAFFFQLKKNFFYYCFSFWNSYYLLLGLLDASSWLIIIISVSLI